MIYIFISQQNQPNLLKFLTKKNLISLIHTYIGKYELKQQS